MENISVIGIDIAKRVFHTVGVNHTGRAVFRARWYAEEVEEKAVQLPKGCEIAMESCGSSHYWGRKFEELGHAVKLIPPQHVKPYRVGQKNDYNDALAICEASSRPAIHSVAVKTQEQQDLQSLHRVREQLMRERVAVSNQVHGLLLEYGYRVSRGLKGFRDSVREILNSSNSRLSTTMRQLIQERFDTFFELEEKIERYEETIEQLCKSMPVVERVMKVRGVGLLTASAIVASVGNAKLFKNGRQFAASLGLVPRQNSTGGTPVLGHITKHGDGYLRKLLVHGARTVVWNATKKNDSLSLWINSLRQRKGANVTAVALANKNARVLWALLAHDTSYEPEKMVAKSPVQ